MEVHCNVTSTWSIQPQVGGEHPEPSNVNFHKVFGTNGCLLGCSARMNAQIQAGNTVATPRRLKSNARKKLMDEINISALRTDYVRSGRNGCGSCTAIAAILDAVFDRAKLQTETKLYQMSNRFLLEEIDPVKGYEAGTRKIQLFIVKGSNVQIQSCASANLITGDTSNQHSLARLKDWLAVCESHTICGRSEEKYLPSRLIDVAPIYQNDIEGIRLIKTLPEQMGIYIALSHCWGITPMPCYTTKDNINQFLDFISFENLSKNFRDAIAITRALGIRYIWIDSLCIIQGDKEDWEIESSRMADVYSQAYLTIAASSSPDSSGGCFSTTESDIRLSLSKESGDLDPLILGARITDTGGLLTDPREMHDRFPLLSRAWVYQERLLSRRILYCNYAEFAFQCLEVNKCECNSVTLSPHFKSQLGPRQYARPEYRLLMARQYEDVNRSLSSCWWDMVGDYMPNKLTYQTDILPALSGCASIIATVIKDDYIAGMWRRSLHKDLIWSNTVSREVKPRGKWTAPTWSWASVQCGQRLKYWGEDVKAKGRITHFLKSSIQRVDYKPKSTTNIFGEITSGSLELYTELFPCHIRRNCNMQKGAGRFDIFHQRKRFQVVCKSNIPDLDIHKLSIGFIPDVKLDKEGLAFGLLSECRDKGKSRHQCALSPVFLLRLSQTETSGKTTDCFMVVREMGPKVFSRIGFIVLTSPSVAQSERWFEKVWTPKALSPSVFTLK